MFGSSIKKYMESLFRQEDGVVLDASTGNVSVRTRQGLVSAVKQTSEDGSVRLEIVVNPIDEFALSLPAFSQPVQISDVRVGDIVMNETAIIGFVEANNGETLNVRRIDGRLTASYRPPRVTNTLGLASGVRVLRPVANMANPEGAQAGLQNILPLLMLEEGDSGKHADLIKLAMLGGLGGQNPFSGLFGGDGQQNPMQTIMMLKLLGK